VREQLSWPGRSSRADLPLPKKRSTRMVRHGERAFHLRTQDIHKELEAVLRNFSGRKKQSFIPPSCFDANGGLFETLLSERMR